MAQATAAFRSSPAQRVIEHRMIAGTAKGPGLRVALLHAPHRPSRAVLHPTSADSVPHAMVRAAVAAVRAAGYPGPITTPALTPEETGGFREAGFTELSNLLLFRMDLHVNDQPERAVHHVRLVTLPRWSGDRPAWLQSALRVDHAAFSLGERFDELSIDEALNATPRRLVRFAVRAAGRRDRRPDTVVGYAITGRAGRRSYLQRLAVHPDHAGEGIGAMLCADSIRWAQAGRASILAVNTRVDNHRAAALYARMGFEPVTGGLVVLRAPDAPDDVAS